MDSPKEKEEADSSCASSKSMKDLSHKKRFDKATVFVRNIPFEATEQELIAR